MCAFLIYQLVLLYLFPVRILWLSKKKYLELVSISYLLGNTEYYAEILSHDDEYTHLNFDLKIHYWNFILMESRDTSEEDFAEGREMNS